MIAVDRSGAVGLVQLNFAGRVPGIAGQPGVQIPRASVYGSNRARTVVPSLRERDMVDLDEAREGLAGHLTEEVDVAVQENHLSDRRIQLRR